MACDLRSLLYAGIHWDGCYVPLDHVARIRSLLGLPLNQHGPLLLDDASPTASLVVDLSHLLDGIITSGALYSAVSARFCPLRTSRCAGADAVTRTTAGVGLDDTTGVSSHQHQSTVVKEQRAFFAAQPHPEGRFRANGSHQLIAADLLPPRLSTSVCWRGYGSLGRPLPARKRLNSRVLDGARYAWPNRT